MNYLDFRNHLLTYLWKVNDADLKASLDNLIFMAEDELNVLLRTQDVEHTAFIHTVSNTVQLPGDYKAMVSVASPKIGQLYYKPPAEIYAMLASYTDTWGRFFSLQGDVLLLAGPYNDTNIPVPPEQRLPLAITYHRKVPRFKDEDASWFADKYLSIYTYGVLRHTAGFLKEDERVSLWDQMYKTALTDLTVEDVHTRKLGVAADANVAYPTTVERPRDRRR